MFGSRSLISSPLMKETPCIRMELELIIYLYFACLERFLNVILEHNLYYLENLIPIFLDFLKLII